MQSNIGERPKFADENDTTYWDHKKGRLCDVRAAQRRKKQRKFNADDWEKIYGGCEQGSDSDSDMDCDSETESDADQENVDPNAGDGAAARPARREGAPRCKCIKCKGKVLATHDDTFQSLDQWHTVLADASTFAAALQMRCEP